MLAVGSVAGARNKHRFFLINILQLNSQYLMPVLRCVLPMLHLEKLCSVNVKMPALQQKIHHGTTYNDHKQLEEGEMSSVHPAQS